MTGQNGWWAFPVVITASIVLFALFWAVANRRRRARGPAAVSGSGAARNGPSRKPVPRRARTARHRGGVDQP